ncbi:MAG: RNA polymerase sigma factor [Bacteroidales bacterium]|nr:RNA polymerase sigma factor [Bacteroidales bacterium]
MEEIYLEMYDVLLHRAASIIGNREDAKDIVQDLYVRIRTSPRLHSVETNRRGYLYGMVTNMSKQFLRSQARHRVLEQSLASGDGGREMSPFSYLDDLLSPLTPLQREVVRLHDIEGYSCLEVALRLVRTPVSVKKQLALAHRKLKENHNKSQL